MRMVWLNGKAESPETAVISVYDRGFLYGDSVFEALRTYGGRPFLLDEHMRRLARSAERVLIAMPLSPDAQAAEVIAAVRAADNDETYIRVMLTRGTGPLGLDPDSAENPSRVIFVEPLVAPPDQMYQRGIAVILVRAARVTDGSPAAGAKVGNYLMSVLSLRQAKQLGAAEALIVDGSGRVLEGTTSNVFAVRGDRLSTPTEESGILAGITRACLLRAAVDLGIPVDIRDLAERDILEADEVFITSSIREVVPVVEVDGRPVGDGTPGPLTRALLQAYRRLTAG
jgi:branched-chain amino acid aminotransferase